MKIIIAGDGKVGAMLTRQLSAEGNDLTLIDNNGKVLESTEERYDIMAVQGNCASMDVLCQAGIEEADLLIAATGADEVNLLCAMTAHGLNSRLHTIARVRNPEYSKQIYQMKEVFPLSLAVNPEKQTADEIERLLKFPGFLRRDTFAKGRVEIVELKVTEDSKLRGATLSTLDSITKAKVLIFAVLRKGKAITPDGNFELQVGDRLFVTASRNDLTVLLKDLGIITHRVKGVMICGGGTLCYYLAEKLLRSGISVKIIEQDHNRCVRLAALLPNANIVCGDASNGQLLDSEGIDNADAVITMTGIDELNMFLSLYASEIGVPQIVTKVGRLENHSMVDKLPLGSIVCPKELCANNIVRYVRAMRNTEGAAISVHTIADGQAEAVEFMVDEKTLHIGEPLKRLRTKKDVLIACITHRAETILPTGDSTFEVGDTVIVVTTGDTIIYQLNDIFE